MFGKKNDETIVMNCGKYDCRHNSEGYCNTKTVGIDKDGKCILASKKPVTMQPAKYNTPVLNEPVDKVEVKPTKDSNTQVIG